jgi:hypothetical protein
MNIIKRLSCLLKLSKCNWDLVEIFPVDVTKQTTKRFFRCSSCTKVRYKINVRQ